MAGKVGVEVMLIAPRVESALIAFGHSNNDMYLHTYCRWKAWVVVESS
jgi:hypothetical protein